MAKYKIFVDGSSGTTGLRIADRLAARDEFEILHISEADRKDVNARAAVINQSDLSFLCLPDAAAREVVPLLRPDVRILDTSTAHRTAPDWVYGLPELHGKRDALRTANRVAVPGCYATGFITLVAPLVELGLLAADYPLTCHGLSGYSGAGKSGIAQYRDPERDIAFESPRPYGLTLDHKHLPEMQKICGLAEPPVFCPIVDDYYCGMEVTVPLRLDLVGHSAEELATALQEYYAGETMIKVHALGTAPKFLPANTLAGKDTLEIYPTVSPDGKRMLLISLLDNLGKGSSGAAVQCMNIMLGLEETKGLETSLQNGIVTPVQDLAAQAQAISGELQKISDLQTNLTNACTAVNTAVNENNAVIDADNGQIAANNEKITSAKTKAISSSQTIQQAVDSLTAKRNEIAQNDPQSAALADLDNAIQALNEAKNAAAEVTDMPELSSIEGKLNPVQADLSGVDVQAVQNAVGKMKVDLFTLKLAAAGMNAKLPEVEEKLDAIQKAGENLPLDQLGALTGKIDDLNTGMQGLNSGIGSLHTNLSSLDQSLAVSVPKAASGIAQLNGGFTQLGSFNSQLTAGAEQLKENSSVLKNGVSALNSGAKTLSEGAVTLADGMKTFDAEGTSKLKTTVEGAVGELMNRLEALTSKECSYDTFSGKDSAMDGNVKFVIETEAIE